MSTFTVLHNNDQLVINPEKLFISHQKWHLVFLYLVVQLLQNFNLPHPKHTYPQAALMSYSDIPSRNIFLATKQDAYLPYLPSLRRTLQTLPELNHKYRSYPYPEAIVACTSSRKHSDSAFYCYKDYVPLLIISTLYHLSHYSRILPSKHTKLHVNHPISLKSFPFPDSINNKNYKKMRLNNTQSDQVINDQNRYSVQISAFHRQNDHILYHAKIADTAFGYQYILRFRFKNLKHLHQQLNKKVQTSELPPFPKTNSWVFFWNRTNQSLALIQQRIRQLEYYLVKLLNNPRLADHPQVKHIQREFKNTASQRRRSMSLPQGHLTKQ